jgi:5-methylcytosine-specific restriction endonuclease McrA
MRDYKKEYREYHGKPSQIRNRAMRNKARRLAIKDGRARKGDGMEVDHKKPISKGGTNHRSNLRIVSRATNRRKGDR